MTLTEQVATACSQIALVTAYEPDLHEAIADTLSDNLGLALTVNREVWLTTFGRKRSRIDLTATDGIETVGIEVKLKGTVSNVERQVHRYTTATPPLDGIVLVTNKAAHRAISGIVNDTPVLVACLAFNLL